MQTGKTTWPIDKLQNWDQNPRTLSKQAYTRAKAQIQRIKEITGEWLYKPLLITDKGVVLGGNMRLKLLRDMEVKEVWVNVVKVSNEQEMLEVAMSDNDEWGKTERDLFLSLVEQFPELQTDLYAQHFEEPVLVTDFLERFSDVDEDEAPALTDEAISKPGEIYQLGRHRLMCGDATEEDDVARLMDGKTAQMVFTDPPYNIDYQGGMNSEGQNKREGIKNDKMDDVVFLAFLTDSIRNMIAHTQGAFYICMSSKELPNLKTAFEETGGHWQSYIIWIKNNFTLSRSDYQNQYEPILYGWNKKIKNHYFIEDRSMGNVWADVSRKAKFIDNKTEITIGGTKLILDGKVTGKIQKGKRRTDIWEYNKPTKSEEHPTMKPIRLCAEAIKNSSREGEIVLDLFGGSGSTLIAAEQTGRICYMSELDPKYVDVIRKRYAAITEQEDWLSATPKVEN